MCFIAPHYFKAKKKSFLSFLKKDKYLIKTPWWLKKLYPNCLWDLPKNEQTIYLTFDDGPHPSITPFLLNELKKHNAKATFFCIGDNVVKYPETYLQLLSEHHAVGNHTFHHLNGWKTQDKLYLKNIAQASRHIQSNLFRPPYGRITKKQITQLHIENPAIKIVMWNILAGDWDENVSPQKCFDRMQDKVNDGDIIVFHDSEKAWPRLQYALPKLLKLLSEKGYRFAAIPTT